MQLSHIPYLNDQESAKRRFQSWFYPQHCDNNRHYMYNDAVGHPVARAEPWLNLLDQENQRSEQYHDHPKYDENGMLNIFASNARNR